MDTRAVPARGGTGRGLELKRWSGTSTLMLGTAIAVAFARNPMTIATVAHDLQALTSGRFVLGLGSRPRPPRRTPLSPWSSRRRGPVRGS
nr:LLM class flavin-dependent oxidoreductase [Frankia sp. Mgl5]